MNTGERAVYNGPSNYERISLFIKDLYLRAAGGATGGGGGHALGRGGGS
jgi:hypothetical protein